MTFEESRLVGVPVATVWTSYDSAREMDAKATANPAHIQSWLNSMTVNDRLALCEENLVQTQLLFGKEVLVTDEKDGWLHVVIPDQPSEKDERGYPGWVPRGQLAEKREDWSLKAGAAASVVSKTAILFSETEEPLFELSFQTTLPVLKIDGPWLKVKTPIGTGKLRQEDVQIFESLENRTKGRGTEIVVAGEKFLGLPYLWGGMSSFGYDCSGFSYSMCQANGYTIPRDAGDQARSGKHVALTGLLPGDLLFFAYEEGKGSIHHVGIYYGDGKMIHSPQTGKNIEIITLAGTYYEKELCAARRYWIETGTQHE